MKVEAFLERIPSDFFTGVPDSQLKALCDALMERYGISERHIIAANEGNAVALATGHFLASGQVPTVYLQNSGEGNAMNPLASLCAKGVYAIPLLLVIGYRGEPGVKDEPQHLFQGEITLSFLDMMAIPYFILEKETTEEELTDAMRGFAAVFREGRQAAIVVKKGALEKSTAFPYRNRYTLIREDAIRTVLSYTGKSPVVSTTGKISREVYEIRDARGGEKVFCLDGDGATLMHLGAMATIGASAPKNFVHILFNNEAHETVGGQPTVSASVQYGKLAEAVGYRKYRKVEERESLEKALQEMAEEEGPILIEICCALHSRADLGRPKSSPLENKKAFMQSLKD